MARRTTSESTESHEQDHTGADALSAPAPRRRRRVTAAAAAPAQAPAAEQPGSVGVLDGVAAFGTDRDDEDGPEASAASDTGSDTAPTPPRRRRKVVAASAAPEAAPAAEPRTALAQAGESDDAESERSEPASTTVLDADPVEGEGEPLVEDEGTEEEDPGVSEARDDGFAQVDTHEEEPEAPRLPAASLLFQAPDPSRARRRRRVTAATSAPQEAPTASRHQGGARDWADDEGGFGSGSRTDAGDREAGDEGEDESSASTSARAGRGARRSRRRRAVADSGAPRPGRGDSADDESSDDAEASQDAAADSRAESSDDAQEGGTRRKRRRGGRGRRSRSRGDDRGDDSARGDLEDGSHDAGEDSSDATPSVRESSADGGAETGAGTASGSRRRRRRSRTRSDSGDPRDEVTALKGSTRLEAKRQRRREGRAAGRRRPIVTEAEFLARRESVDRQMIVRESDGLNQIAVLEDGLLVEHYVSRHTQTSMVGNVYVGRVQNVLPSMEAAFVDLGKGRNAVLYAGEVNWDAAGLEGRPRRIEDALSSGDTVLVQVTKDPIGHKGARLTSQITLAGRYLVLVPGGSMTGISRKLPDTERSRLKKILKRIVPDSAGVIVRTAAEGASQEQLTSDVERLVAQWEAIEKKASSVMKGSGKAPVLLKGEPELAVRVIRDVFNEDFRKLIVSGDRTWSTISQYIDEVSPDLAERLEHWTGPEEVFAAHRVDEQLAKGFDRKVWLPSGGTLVIDRTEAMTVIDVNTGRFTGAGGTLEETVTRNNLEAAEEIVRQLRLRDIGGIIVIDFIDMVLEANRELVLRRLVECLGRDRTRHQVAEVTSLGLVQMTRKRVGQGLVEAFSTVCQTCEGRGFITHAHPVERNESGSGRSSRKAKAEARTEESKRHEVKDALNSIAAAASKHDEDPQTPPAADASDQAKAGAKKASAGKSARGGQSRVRARGRKSSAAEQAGVAGGEPEKPAAEDAPKAGESSAGAEAPTEGGPNASGAGEGEAAAARGADGAETQDAVATPDGQGGEESPDEPDGKGTPEDARSRKHRVSSSGTITPGASQASAILSFPAK